MDYLHRNKHTFLQSYGEKARREAELYGNTPKEDHVLRYRESSSLLLPAACPILAPSGREAGTARKDPAFLQSSEINAGPALGHSWLLCYLVRPALVATSDLQAAPDSKELANCVLESELASTHASSSMPVGNISWHC